MRLIDIDRMINVLKEVAAFEDDEATRTLDKFGVQFIERVINHYVQITEKNLGHTEDIVRCKDCKWFGDFGCAIRIADDSDKPTENDFCSFAERRTDETD